MNVFAFLTNEEEKVVAWIKSKEPEFISAIQQAAKFTSAAIAWSKSPEGQSVEQFLEANIKNSPKWIEEATIIATALLTDMLAVKSPAALEGIAERLGAEILQILDGKKLPTGISGYVAEFQAIFVG